MASDKSRMQKLDSGGQGQIYAVNSTTIYKSIKFSDHYKEISELCVLKALPHPCIPEVRRWELSRNECKIYMERLYSNIYEYSKKCSFERRLELFPNIFWSMVRVARYFQLNGIINCDIKSENVMISKDGTSVKVIDFGHLISEEDYPIVGTRSYQPPELWLDDTCTYKSMVWSIGITALEFLYRVHPVVDMIYGTEDDSPSPVSSESKHSSSTDNEYSVEDEFRERYTNLFQILQEEGQKSLPFRHRIDSVDKKYRDKLSSINFILDRMLTYDQKKRISLEELYHCRIFDNIRGAVKEEKVVTHQRDSVFLNKELTPLFLSLGRKLYREEVMTQAYIILSMYLDKHGSILRDKQEFTLTSLACLDIISYVFSMVPSSRDVHRKIILKMKGINESLVFDRVVEVLKDIDFKVFQRIPVLHIKQHEHAVLYPLLLELIEADADAGKKKLAIRNLMERYSSEDYSSDKESDSEDSSDDDEKKEESDNESEAEDELDEEDIDFIKEFRKRIENVYKEDKIRRSEEDDAIEIQIL